MNLTKEEIKQKKYYRINMTGSDPALIAPAKTKSWLQREFDLI